MPKDTKRPFYKQKRWYLLFFGLMIIFYIIGAAMEKSEAEKLEEQRLVAQQEKEQKKKEKEEKREAAKKEKIEKEKEKKQEEKEQAEEKASDEKIIKLNTELIFLNFKVSMDTVKIYKDEDKFFIDLPIDWLNQSFPEKKTFLAATIMSVYQGDTDLEEVNDAWLTSTSSVYATNAVGGVWPLRLTYELIDNETPVRIVFVPLDENDEKQELTINIK